MLTRPLLIRTVRLSSTLGSRTLGLLLSFTFALGAATGCAAGRTSELTKPKDTFVASSASLEEVERTESQSPTAASFNTDNSPVEAASASAASDSSAVSIHHKRKASLSASADPMVDTIEPATLMSVNVQGLEVGMLYSEARTRLLEQGWIPHTFATNGAIADWNDSSIQQMSELGFAEVKACSGTGAGLCSFEFVFGQDRAAENGAVLSVSASRGGQSETGEPTLWSWGMRNSVNTIYENQFFDKAIYGQLRAEGFCPDAGRCENQKYAFKDVLLWSALGDFGTTKVSIFPRYTGKSLSRDEALAYARMLDVDNVIDFDDRRLSRFDSSETYYEFGTPQENIADGRGGVTLVQLSYQENGTLSEISFKNVVF